MNRVVVILGATSGIARAVAVEYARRDRDLLLAARDFEECEAVARDLAVRYGVRAEAMVWDAADFDGHADFFAKCLERAGEGLEGVVLCSGFMDEQAKAQADWPTAKRTMDVNLTGPVTTLERFAAHFEARRSGFIAALSSVAGDRGRQSNYIYGASKAGLTAYLQGLRNRLCHAGVPVTTIKPGFVDTSMTWGKPGLFLVASPESAARAIVRAIEKRKDVAYVPWFWRYIILIIRAVPEFQFKRMRM